MVRAFEAACGSDRAGVVEKHYGKIGVEDKSYLAMIFSKGNMI